MMKICLTGSGYNDVHFKKLQAKQFEITHLTAPVTQTKLKAIIPKFDAYILGGDERFTADELRQAEHLKVISFVGTGYSSFIDELAANKFDIAIKNTPAVMAPAVAEQTIGFLIGLQRKLFQQNWEVKNSCVKPVCTEELSSLRIGIIGMGEIGSRIAKILSQSFGSEVIYNSKNPKKHLEDTLGIKFVTQDKLITTADVIILSIPTNNETTFFLNESLLAMTKPGVVIINTAGARLIEPYALKKYLDTHHVAVAAFDGYYIEPLPKVADDPYHLLALPDNQFVLTPHTAAKTSQSWCRMINMAVDNVVDFFKD